MLVWLWRLLVGGCKHKWQVRNQGAMTSQGRCVGQLLILQCEKCGNIKREEVWV